MKVLVKICSLLVVILHGLPVAAQDDRYSDSFIDVISHYPTIKKQNNELNKQDAAFQYIVWSKPTRKEPYYNIEVGINKDPAFVPYYIFHCYRKRGVYLFDVHKEREIKITSDVPKGWVIINNRLSDNFLGGHMRGMCLNPGA